LGLPLGEADAVGLGEGHGVGDALVTTVADGLRDPEAEGFGVGVGVELGLAAADPDGVEEAERQLGAGVGCSRVWFDGAVVLALPSRIRAAGTTRRPRMTVTTKASAPHSWSQKARDELRIRVRRPIRAGACYGY